MFISCFHELEHRIALHSEELSTDHQLKRCTSLQSGFFILSESQLGCLIFSVVSSLRRLTVTSTSTTSARGALPSAGTTSRR